MQNMDNRCNLNAYPRIGRNSIPNIVDKRKRNNEPTNGISIWRATRAKKGEYTEEDGAADIDEQLQRPLDELPDEERDDPEKRERIFVDVVGNDGHGRVLCGGMGTRLGYTSSGASTGTSPSSTHDIEAELAKLKDEIAERDRSDVERDNEIAALKARDAERDSETAALKAIVQVSQQSSMDAEARVIRLLHNAGINTSLVFASNPSPGQSSGHGSNSRNHTNLA